MLDTVPWSICIVLVQPSENGSSNYAVLSLRKLIIKLLSSARHTDHRVTRKLLDITQDGALCLESTRISKSRIRLFCI